jgi:hypothetical protein
MYEIWVELGADGGMSQVLLAGYLFLLSFMFHHI